MTLKNINFKKLYILLFLLAQICLYPFVVFGVGNVRVVAYVAILLCFATSLVLLQKNKQSLLLAVALFCTACADFFLILKGGSNKNLAMCFFVVAQLAYGARTLLFANNKKEFWANVISRCVLMSGLVIGSFAVVGSLLVVSDTPAYVVFSMIYFGNLLTNLAFAFLHFKQNKMLAVGLLLFVCCDLFVGFGEMINLLDLGADHFITKLVRAPVSIHSIFYHPSQVLLSLSATKKIK